MRYKVCVQYSMYHPTRRPLTAALSSILLSERFLGAWSAVTPPVVVQLDYFTTHHHKYVTDNEQNVSCTTNHGSPRFVSVDNVTALTLRQLIILSH